ncbi:MAG: hypothetical protein HW378_4421, partial [Anaerolineales bacterium]|nr:hypothetical protein [Anaerolineales bacterium]
MAGTLVVLESLNVTDLRALFKG